MAGLIPTLRLRGAQLEHWGQLEETRFSLPYAGGASLYVAEPFVLQEEVTGPVLHPGSEPGGAGAHGGGRGSAPCAVPAAAAPPGGRAGAGGPALPCCPGPRPPRAPPRVCQHLLGDE